MGLMGKSVPPKYIVIDNNSIYFYNGLEET